MGTGYGVSVRDKAGFLVFQTGISDFLWIYDHFMLVGRFLWKLNVRRIVWKGKNQPNFLVISTQEYATETVRQFSDRMYNGFNLAGLAIMDRDLWKNEKDRKGFRL